MDKYAVMGNPIKHSKSPLIHKMFAEQTGEPVQYDAILVELDGFAAAVNTFCQQGGRGLNITVPFKQEAWELVEERAFRAEKAGAVNTIIIEPGQPLRGDNTDGYGLVRDLEVNHSVLLDGKRILVLGAGGAVRGILGPLFIAGVDSVVIANRTVQRAQDLAVLFADEGGIAACSFEDQILDSQFDVVINGTSASLQGDVPSVPASTVKNAVCYDMMYGTELTPFLRWSQNNQADSCIDGLGMLVEQAAESFYLWRGVRPETKQVLNALR